MFFTIKEKLERINELVGDNKNTDALVLLPQVKALLVETEERVQGALEDSEIRLQKMEMEKARCFLCRILFKR